MIGSSVFIRPPVAEEAGFFLRLVQQNAALRQSNRYLETSASARPKYGAPQALAAPPKGVKVMLPKGGDFNHVDFNDVVPSFGDTPAIE
jgi:hypothetical protein